MDRRVRGYNLLETILAGVLFSIVSVGLIGLWTNYARAMEKSRHRIVASYLAEKVMEECLALGYDLVDGKAANSPVVHELTHKYRGQTIPTRYQVRVGVVPNVGGLDTKAVKVTVEWHDTTTQLNSGTSTSPFDGARSVVLETVLIPG